ncbi:MAG: cadherin-like domain-containing protein, partial [Rhizobiaceae bacterium]|nr:cadherin-like domain-containing protein [Rhizobiaceae bacterium]
DNSTDAVDDATTTSVETPVTIDVLANDRDAEEDRQFIDSFTDGGNGTVAEGPDGALIYTPNAGFTGTDTFTYTILDARGETDTATVTVTIEDDGGPTITGTPEDDLICGTEEDDHINGGDGIDVFGGSQGDDILDGGDDGYNQVNYGGLPTEYIFTANPDGTVSVEKPDGAGTDTLINVDGAWFAGDDKWYAIDDLINSSTEELTTVTEPVVEPEVVEPQVVDPVVEAPKADEGPEVGATIVGTCNDDRIMGTDGNDHIDGMYGVDVIKGSAGDDIINGGDSGFNQVNYAGRPSDYVFRMGSEGSVIVEKPGQAGTDTLIDIDGILFEAEYEFFAIEDLVKANEGASATVKADTAAEASNDNQAADGSADPIVGTDADDYLLGTAGNDIIDGGAGLDVIRGSQGDDIIKGGDSGYNQVDYDGQASDYLIVSNADGSYKVTAPNGDVDLLVDISGVWFAGEDAWYEIEDLV